MKEPQPPYGMPPKKLLDTIESTKNKIFDLLMSDEHFNAFIEEVDQHSTGELIETLFGSEESYVDTPGNYAEEKESFGGSAVEHYIMNYGGGGGKPDEVLAMYAWYIGNLYKVHAWMTTISDNLRNDQK